MTITRPRIDCDLYADVPLDERRRVSAWLDAFDAIHTWKPIRTALETVADLVGATLGCRVTYHTARRNYDALRSSGGDWRALVDARRLRSSEIISDRLTARREFRSGLVALAERHHRKSKPAWRKFQQAWARRDAIPGCEDFPGWPQLPFTYTTFCRILREETDRRRLLSIRIGTTSKTNPGLPQVFTTRVGMHVGQLVQIDDVWHDHLVMIGQDPRPRRVMEFGAMDVFSGCRFHWGLKPRLPKDGETMGNLNEAEMRQFIAGLLWTHGTHPAGTTFLVEHGTAALRDDVVAILQGAGLGITVDRQPIERTHALLNYWGTSQGGNFRAKAALESIHNLIHNDLSHLALQTGSHHSGIAGPLTTEPKAAWIEKTLKAIAAKAPHRLDLFRRMDALDFHGEFLPLLRDYYDFGLNGRTDHELEGWEALGFIQTRYTAAPGSGHYLTSEQFLALPRPAQLAISEAAKEDPAAWCQRVRLSPAEVWNAGRRTMRPVPAPLICDILGKDLAREVTVRGSYIRFKDADIAPDPLIYEARATFLNGAQRELRDQEKFSALVLPFCPRHLFLLDARDRYIGHCELAQRITATDRAGRIAAATWNGHRAAEIHEPLRIRHAEQVQAEARDRDWNTRLADPEAPITAEEHAQVRRSAAARAVHTRRINATTDDRLEETWEAVTSAPAAEDEDPDAGDLSDLL